MNDLIADMAPVFPPMQQVSLPCGSAVLTSRALVKDCWITWRDALPDQEELWSHLTHEAVEEITSLARALHGMHRAMKTYKSTDESPFHISRWWDPTADDDYDTGRFCLMKFKNFTAHQLTTCVPRSSSLIFTAVSPKAPQWVEATVSQPMLPLTGAGLFAPATSGAREVSELSGSTSLPTLR